MSTTQNALEQAWGHGDLVNSTNESQTSVRQRGPCTSLGRIKKISTSCVCIKLLKDIFRKTALTEFAALDLNSPIFKILSKVAIYSLQTRLEEYTAPVKCLLGRLCHAATQCRDPYIRHHCRPHELRIKINIDMVAENQYNCQANSQLVANMFPGTSCIFQSNNLGQMHGSRIVVWHFHVFRLYWACKSLIQSCISIYSSTYHHHLLGKPIGSNIKNSALTIAANCLGLVQDLQIWVLIIKGCRCALLP